MYNPRREPTVDVVFVHGLNGHPYDSWTSQSGCFWPADLLPDVLGLLWPRILTYGYNANVAAFTGGAIVSHAEMLAWNLAANRTVGALVNVLSFPPQRYLMMWWKLTDLV